MAIAAHPGDAVFTMGAAVAQHIESGGAGLFVSLTLGEKGAPRGTPVTDYGAMQRSASTKAAKVLGAEFEIMSWPDAEVPLTDDTALDLCDVIRRHTPDIVITHWSGSWHKDHQNCHLVTRDAIFYAGLTTLSRDVPSHSVRKLYYAENWEDSEDFKADTYLDISRVFDKWIAACELYPMWRGQTGFRYHDYYSSLTVMRGCLSGFQRAVALMSDPNQRTKNLRSLNDR